jgi:hypothetical protein
MKGLGIELVILVKFGMWRDYCETVYSGKIVDLWKDRVESEWKEWKVLRYSPIPLDSVTCRFFFKLINDIHKKPKQTKLCIF